MIESSDPKIFAAIAKVETDKELKSDFEATSACILLCDTVSNNKAYSNNNDKHSASDIGIVSIAGGRDRETKTDLRFYDIEHLQFSAREFF